MFTIQVIFFLLFLLFFFGLPISGILFPNEPISQRWVKVPFPGYVGRAWHDQCNYVTIAQFLADYPFSASSIDLTDQPYAQRAVALKNDRIGQSVYHALVLTSANSHAKSTFEGTILIYPLLAAIAVFWIASSPYSGHHALIAMFWAGISSHFGCRSKYLD